MSIISGHLWTTLGKGVAAHYMRVDGTWTMPKQEGYLVDPNLIDALLERDKDERDSSRDNSATRECR